MDNKNFNADQSIELIQRMIRDTRRNLSSGSSNLFILWGYLLAATAVGIFLLLTFTESRAWQWLWLPALAAGWAATWWYNRRRVSQVKSYTDRLLEQVWGCIAGLAAFSTFVICMEREWPVDPLFPVLLLISAGLFISGTVIHNKYMYYVSCFLLPVAFGIIRESWINVNPDGNLIQFAVAVLVGLTGSGYALKRQVKRDAAEASETDNTMEDRKLEAAESLALIGRMIENTRSRMVRNSGRPLLAWGYATVLTTLAVWGAVLYFQDPRWNYLWLMLPLLGWLLMWISREKKPEGEVRTFVDRVIGNVWTVMGLSAWFVSMLALFMPMRLPILFIILLIMGMGTTVTGLIIRFTPTAVGGVAAIILAPFTLIAGNMWQPLLFIAGFVVMMIVPGHILNYKSNHPAR